MDNLEARSQLKELRVEIDPTDSRSALEILNFIQGLATSKADVVVAQVEVPGESSIISANG